VSTIFSTANTPATEQLDRWRDAVCSVFMPLSVDAPPAGRTGFNGRLTRHSDGALALAEVVVEGHSVSRTDREIRESRDDSLLLLVQRAGDTWVEQEGRSGWLRPGEFLLLDSARAYTMRFPHPVHHEILKVPATMLRASVKNLERFTGVKMSGAAGVGKILLGVLEGVRAEAPRFERATAAGVADALVDLVSASVRSLQAGQETEPSRLELYHRERVRHVVRERMFDSDLSVESIAAAVNLSTRYVHRLFEGESLTLSAWIWRERLEAARKALAAPDRVRRSTTDIAYSVGFKDPAHFSRLFKSTYGDSPRAYKARLLRDG
jgi:AraC-like DNA-binding protein